MTSTEVRSRQLRRLYEWMRLCLFILVLTAGCACSDYETGANDDDLASDDDSTGDDDVADDDDTDDDDDDDDDSSDDDDDTADTGPCADGGWGDIPYTERPEFFVVSTAGSPTGDGSLESPFDAIEAAVEQARTQGGEWLIGIAEGEYTVNLELGEDDEGLWIAGCSTAGVILVPPDTDNPGIGIRQTNGAQLRSLTVKGGYPGIAVTQNSGADAPIVLADLAVSEALGVGIVIDGTTGKNPTVAELEAIAVDGTLTVGNQLGWGISVQGAQATLTDISITNVTQVGLFGHSAEIEVERLTVDNVAVDAAGTFGRGVHLQLFTEGAIRDSSVSNCSDAGVFLNACSAMILSDIEVWNTSAAVIPDSVNLSGDGIVASAGTLEFLPEFFPVAAADCNVHDNGRAGIVLDGVEGEVDGTIWADNIFMPGGWGVVSQNLGINTGADDTYDLDVEVDFDPIDLNLNVLSWMIVSND